MDDVPWVRELFVRRFGNYDVDTAEAWYRNVVLVNQIAWLAIRTSHGFLTAYLRQLPWLPTRSECQVTTVCCDEGHHWQAVPLLRASLKWARERRCAAWYYESDTDTDIAPLMHRLDAIRLDRYRVDLEER